MTTPYATRSSWEIDHKCIFVAENENSSLKSTLVPICHIRTIQSAPSPRETWRFSFISHRGVSTWFLKMTSPKDLYKLTFEVQYLKIVSCFRRRSTCSHYVPVALSWSLSKPATGWRQTEKYEAHHLWLLQETSASTRSWSDLWPISSAWSRSWLLGWASPPTPWTFRRSSARFVTSHSRRLAREILL